MGFWQKFFGLETPKSSLPASTLEINPVEAESNIQGSEC